MFHPILYCLWYMHSRGIFEVKDLTNLERGVDGKQFTKVIHELHEDINMKLKEVINNT